MSRIKHLLFDCDGVLVDTEYTAAIRMCAALERQGVVVSLDHYLDHHSGTTFSAILNQYFGETLSKDLKLKVMNRVEQEVADEVKLVGGMNELLSSLPIHKSVVSNSSIETVRHALLTTGINRYFNNRIFSSEQVSNAKPAPDLYYFAMKQLQLKPDEILVIEDSLTGVQAARSAGLNVIGFAGASHIRSGHDKKLIKLGVLDVATNTKELSNILVDRLA